jgi:CPA2 family monovalent cation:H+ antiporter-2
MTAASLLIVVGAAFAMEVSGLSMGMGAFIAGIMLANSSFRHQLESDIEPFKGLTLGLFFMAIGMTLDLGLLMAKPFILFVAAIGLMAVKTAVITLLLRLAKIDWTKGLQAGLMLSQGGEFAFVVMAQATSNGVVSEELAGQVNLVVGLSMALTSPLVALLARLCARRPQESGEVQSEPLFDHDPEVLIMGFGRFGQSTGRILAAKGIPFTALDKNPEQIAFVKRFGNQVHYGDPTQLKVMRAAGIDKVKVVFIAIDNQEQAEKIVSLIRHEYPKVHIVARAHNRAHYWALRAAGAHSVVREMFKGSLQAASKTLTALGYSLGEALRTIDEFELHDEAMLEQTFQHRDDLEKLIEIGRQGRTDLERLFKEDRHY